MKGFIVSAFAETASFRDPGAQLYHSCLPLPPFSTLVGLTGAAKGLNFEQALDYFKLNKILVGVSGTNEGQGRDLWNYSKIAGGNKVKKDIVNREFLAKLSLQIFYASESDEIIDSIRKAFLDPVYCLTIGNSDDLLLIKNISPHIKVKQIKSKNVANTVLFGDISDLYEFDWETIKNSALNIKLGTPVVKKLPVDYTFLKQVRKGSRYEILSFVPEMVRLKESINMYNFGEAAVPMFSL